MGDSADRLEEHKTRFRCHVCGVASAGPFCVDDPGESLGYGAAFNWDIPRDLVRCEECGRWACQTHIKNMGFESWWICILCYHQHLAGIEEELATLRR
jgi:hypothetical protein